MAAIRDLIPQDIGIYVSDPTKMVNITMASNNTTDFASMHSIPMRDGDITPKWGPIIEKLELKVYTQSIRIIQLENKLDSEECENLKKMLESNDEASVILAKEIIDNLETA